MKRIINLLLLIAACLTIQAQVDLSVIKKVTEADFRPQFLGIPVDGSKEDMIKALKSKGFKYDEQEDYLSGRFNGKDVEVMISTNHDLVDRVFVSYVTVDESQIINQYNTLLKQFKNNSKYIELVDNKPIDEKENISYEMTIHHNDYQAAFWYFPSDISFKDFSNTYKNLLKAIRTGEKIEGLEDIDFDAEVLQSMKEVSEEEWKEFDKLSNNDWDEIFKYMILSNNPSMVWFNISRIGSRYSINIFYDNEENRPNGEDL